MHLQIPNLRPVRGYPLALGLTALLALGSLGLLLGQVHSQGRYARMIEHRETQRILTLHVALSSMLLRQESDPTHQDQDRRAIADGLEEIEHLQQQFPANKGDDRATTVLAAELRWFAEAEHALLVHRQTAAPAADTSDLKDILAAVPGNLRLAFDDTFESLRAGSLRRTHLYQVLASGAVLTLLLTLLAEARWIFQPMLRDIRREHRALAESRQRLAAVLNTVGEAILVADAQNVIEMVNSEAARIWGFPPEDLIGRSLNALVLAGRELTPAAWRAMFPVAGRLKTVGTRQDGQPFGLEMSLTNTSLPVNENPQPALLAEHAVFTISARDITAQLEADRLLAGARDTALDAARAKDAIVANMSHGLRTPIGAIRENTNHLIHTALTPEQRGFLEHIGRHGDALQAVLDDLLDLSQLEDGKLMLKDDDFDLRRLVEGAADVFAGRAVQKQLEFVVFVAPDVPTALRGDPARLRQVLLNLLGNALKFTRRGEVVLEVSVDTAEETHVTLRFAVGDTGIGISPADRSRLFHAFAPGEEITASHAVGRGLGLTICRHLVERMGGTIAVESNPGGGSMFWFTARLEKQTVRSEADLRAESQHSAWAAGLRNVRVLIVDDNATCRKLVSAQLHAWGMLPATAESGGTALAQMREQALAGTPFEVALLDLNLGSMDGFTLAWGIHSQPLLSQTRLLLVTSLGLDHDRVANREVGIRGSVSKPLKYGTVLEVLARVMASSDAALSSKLSSGWTGLPEQTHRLDMSDAPLRTGGKRILLADDNPISRKMTLRQLTNLGFAADAVANGHEALAALRAQPYGLLMLDIHMPVMDGYETARAVRRLLHKQRADHLVLVAITANRTNGDRQRCLEAGMNDYLSKPVRQEDLDRMLTRWTGAAYAQPAAGAEPVAAVVTGDSTIERGSSCHRGAGQL